MAFNINTFKSELNKTGIVKTSNFEVQITPPTAITNADLLKSMAMRAQSVSMPGRSISTVDYEIYGPVQKIASGSQFDDITINFILSESLTEKEFFENWQDLIVGKYRQSEGKAVYDQMDLSFYNTYIGELIITRFDDLGKPKKKLKCIEVYPSNVGNISYTWADVNIATLDVTFAYRYHY
jgi:hypothetical protein